MKSYFFGGEVMRLSFHHLPAIVDVYPAFLRLNDRAAFEVFFLRPHEEKFFLPWERKNSPTRLGKSLPSETDCFLLPSRKNSFSQLSRKV